MASEGPPAKRPPQIELADLLVAGLLVASLCCPLSLVMIVQLAKIRWTLIH
jgi:hypothetical protein|tara:strand:- start:1764 stop:1916 length:153 start_codon:yes stop_codon:yes gene_type:complete